MAFQIKNFVSIVAGMINHVRSSQSAVTDFNVGSVVRTMLEAPAVEIDELYQQMFVGLREAIPVATYNSFSFARLAAAAAVGVVRVTITASGSATLIPAGTVFSSPDAPVNFVSQSDVTIVAAGTTGDVLVAASTVGGAGNVPAGLDFVMSPAPSGFVSATNLAAFISGRDEESDEERKQRFKLFVSTLARGTVAALIYGAKTAAIYDANGAETERVQAVSVVEPYLSDPGEPVALVKVYVHNGVGSTSVPLANRVAEILHGYTDASGVKVPGWKAAGVKVEVYRATEVSLAMTATLTPSPGFDEAALIDSAEAVLADYVRSLDIGQSYVDAEAIYRVKSIPGVANFVFSTPTADQAATASQKLVPGTITITGA